MIKKKISIIFVISLFLLTSVFFIPHDKIYKVIDCVSPTEISLDKKVFKFNDLETFDSYFSDKNKNLAKAFNISEEDAFILGNLGKYWTKNLINNRKVIIKNNNDLIFYKYSYRTKFINSSYCIKENKACSQKALEKALYHIEKANYQVLDLDSNEIYSLKDSEIRNLKNFVLLRKSHISKLKKTKFKTEPKTSNVYIKNNLKVILSDSTTVLKPNNNCTTLMCKEILSNINNAQKSIDIALYGYSRVDEIEKALKNAVKRGVTIRLIHDSDDKGHNIYPDTKAFSELFQYKNCDMESIDAKNIMHNKFYIFDDKTLITGSANLSHTDMSGFNSNAIIVIDSKEIAKIYKTEFEQMLAGKFHTEKIKYKHEPLIVSGIKTNIYFSPQDKGIQNAILPLIKSAEKYVYIPTFVLTEKNIVQALIEAHRRGVEVKIIMDALNGSIRHSKHNELRAAGIPVKTENFAGKMHSKSIIIDDKYTIIGSMNFSNSGENKNDENFILIEDSDITRFYKDFFLYQWNKIDNKWLKYNIRAEGKDSIGSCFDGLDNNYDGLIDKDDPACKL